MYLVLYHTNLLANIIKVKKIRYDTLLSWSVCRNEYSNYIKIILFLPDCALLSYLQTVVCVTRAL